MSLGKRHLGLVVALVLAIGLTTGCTTTHRPYDTKRPVNSALLLPRDGSLALATEIGRSAWPATYGGIESPQQTVFFEYYRDYQGHESLEKNNPRRIFRSYRIGFQQR